jgi:cytochrome c-type biogenesis protein CcmH
MVLWIVFAVLSGVAALAVLAPLTRARGPEPAAGEADLSIYRDQLEELERDLERGIIAADEAAAARAEVGRRLLAAKSRMDKAVSRQSGGTALKGAIWAAVAAVPLFSVALYLALGSPHLPGQPLQARLQASVEQQDLQAMVARVERHLAENPQDGRGWEVLAPVYLRLGRYTDSARAWRNSVRILGPSPERLANLGESIVLAEDGVVTDEARRAFEAALEEEPDAMQSRFYLAVAAEQDGDWSDALVRWRGILADTPEDAPWQGVVAERLAAAEQATGAAPGPTAGEVAATEDMSEDERAAFIAGMVERLAERLAADGGDLEDWLRLARAHAVLGEMTEAREAIGSARNNFADDPAAGARIDAAERELGLDL